METTLKRPAAGHGYTPDFEWGDTVVEVKADPHSFRNLRAGLLQLAYYLAGRPDRRGMLVLGNPRITDVALQEEWRLAEQTLKKEVLDRLSVVAKRGDEIIVVAGKLEPGLRERMGDMIVQEARIPVRTRPATEAIFLVLLLHWFRRGGPMTTQYLMQTVGCSYPTVASAVRRLGSWVKRFSDRRIQLWGFPAEEWQRVVAGRDRVHPIIRYVDRSGQRRSPEALLDRAVNLGIGELAVGGVIAARHYYPQLDLRGTPRLDLTLHCPPKKKADLSFVERLDPALERTQSKSEPVALAVHILGTQEAFFKTVGDGLPLADEVDCLLSLHDAQLEAQAKEFLDHLVASVG
jgi:hypothetical protein